MRAWLAGVGLVLLFGCSMGGHRKVGSVRTSVAPQAPITLLRVENGAGTLHVQRASGPEVVIEVEVWLREGRPDTDFAPVFADHVTVAERGGVFSVESAHLRAADGDDWQLRLTLSVPSGVGIDFQQSVGLVRVELPEITGGRVKVDTGSVAFDVPVVRGALAVDVDTGEASITVRDTGPTEGLRAACDTGQLTVTLPADACGTFELRAGTGALDVAARYGLAENRSHAQVESRGRVGEGGPAFSLTVGTGQVRLR